LLGVDADVPPGLSTFTTEVLDLSFHNGVLRCSGRRIISVAASAFGMDSQASQVIEDEAPAAIAENEVGRAFRDLYL